METKQTEWKTLADIKTFRTSNPKEMLGKWLAEPMTKKWTEDFIDEDTGEVISIERTERILDKNTRLDKETITRIMFSIQAEEVEDVCVTDQPIFTNRMVGSNLTPYEVTTSNLEGTKMFLTRATSIEAAIECVRNYIPIYGDLSYDYFVTQVARKSYHIADDDDSIKNEEQCDHRTNEYEFFKTTARLYEVIDLEKVNKTNCTIIIKAKDVGEAKQNAMEWMQKTFKEVLIHPINKAVILKAAPYETDGIVPADYCELFKEKSNY